jgi:MFS family permease
MLVLTSVTNAINNANLGSTLATGVESLSKNFKVTNKVLLTLPTSLYMLGYVIGPTIAGPTSERYGRRIVLNTGFTIYTIFALACVGAPNFAALVVFRLFMGMGAAVPLSIIGG